MPETRAAAPTKSVLTSLTARYDQGFRIYRPTLNIDDDEEAQYDKRRMYILQAERDHQDVLHHIAAVIRARSVYGRSLTAVGSALADLDGDRHDFGGALVRVADANNRIGTAIKEQVRDEVFHFGDALLEYRNQTGAFKVRAFGSGAGWGWGWGWGGWMG